MKEFRIDNDPCPALAPRAARTYLGLTPAPCVPRIADGRCVFCERELPTRRELEAQADMPIPYGLTEHGRRVVVGLETSIADVCAGCGADRLEIFRGGHRRIDHRGAQVTDDGPALFCPERCSCSTGGWQCFSMAEHRAWAAGQDAV